LASACLFRGFSRRFFGGFLSLGSICRGLCLSLRRAAAVFLALAFFQPKDAALITAADLATSRRHQVV
jgi:hypothetical protein